MAEESASSLGNAISRAIEIDPANIGACCLAAQFGTNEGQKGARSTALRIKLQSKSGFDHVLTCGMPHAQQWSRLAS